MRCRASSPAVNHPTCFFEHVVNFAVLQFNAKRVIGRYDLAVLPNLALRDIPSFDIAFSATTVKSPYFCKSRLLSLRRPLDGRPTGMRVAKQPADHDQ